MKWIFLLGLVFLTPALTLLLRQNRQHLPKAAFLLGLLPFIESGFNVSAAPYSWPMWQGIVKGIEVSLTDSLALAMILSSSRVRTPAVLKIAFGLYVLAFLISTAVAQSKMPSLFYGWQLVRAVVVYQAVARASQSAPGLPLALLTGLIFGLASQAIVVAVQYAGGTAQAGGWFGHQNLLGMATHFIVYPAFAAFLAGHHSARMGLAVVSAMIVAFAGGSRATIALIVAGLVITIVLSAMRGVTGRKASIAGAALIALLAVSPLLYSAVGRRSEATRAQSSEERARMMSAAGMIVRDYPLGVGANRYVVVTNVGGYSARANLVPTEANLSAPVHNTYYLVAAEMGWFGLVSLVALFASIIAIAFNVARRASSGFGGDYAVGLKVTFLVVAVHAYVEWITMIYQIHLMFAMSLAALIAIRTEFDPTRATPVAGDNNPGSG